MKQKIIMYRGCQGSGKSFHAKKFVAENKGWVRISNDEMRLMFFNRVFDKGDTNDIDYARELLVEVFLKRRKSIVVDAMNLSPKHEANYRKLAEQYGCDFEIVDFTSTPLATCIERDKLRPNPVGEKVIRQTWKQFIYKEPPKIEYDPGLPNAIWADLDGTLSIMKDRSPYEEQKCVNDEVNYSVVHAILAQRLTGTKIILCSGRDEGRGRQATEEWLKLHSIPYDFLFMRKAGDVRKDSIVKKEIYENEIKGKYNLLYCMDDRDQVVLMLRELGLSVFQVNYGDF